MENFYQLLSTASQSRNKYLETLAAITKASHIQIQAVASDLAWQSWDAQTTSA